jgi:hypothetical protein
MVSRERKEMSSRGSSKQIEANSSRENITAEILYEKAMRSERLKVLVSKIPAVV